MREKHAHVPCKNLPPIAYFVYSDQYSFNIGTHVFPVEKYPRLRERLIKELKIPKSSFIEPKPATIEELRLAHTQKYINDFVNLKWTDRTIRSEVPLTREIVDAFILSVGGTIFASELALKNSCGFHIGGGWHHAFPDWAEGFCYLNDTAIAIRKLQKEKPGIKISVIDCDLHQGNGTAFIFSDDPSVFTFSIHQENLYPVKQKSKLDIGLSDFAGDPEYSAGLEQGIRAGIIKFRPDIIFYLAGADPYMGDQLGTLRVSMEGLEKRDRMVIGTCAKAGIPVVITLAGGYANNVSDTVQIHFNTARVMLEELSIMSP